MIPILLVDGNNLGHVLGYIDKATQHYDTGGLLSCLDGIARHLAQQGQQVEIVLFLDDVAAAEQLSGWHVEVAAVPDGDADSAIRAFAQQHAGRHQILVSGDQVLCDDAAMWGTVCLSPRAFVSHYLIPASAAGVLASGTEAKLEIPLGQEGASEELTRPPREPKSPQVQDQGAVDRQRQFTVLKRAEASLRGQQPPPLEVFRLDLTHSSDTAELALYLAEHHLCPNHLELTHPNDMIAAIREHCSQQPRYFSSGRVINRVFRLFLCRSEHTLSLEDLARLAKTRRRKIRSAISKYGERLGIVSVW